MGKMTHIQKLYPEEYRLEGECGVLDLDDYSPIINDLGNVLFTLSDDDYSGDTFVLYYNSGTWGCLEFGWGSCSACDALQGCSDWEEVEELYSQLQDKILRFYKTKDILDYFMNHDWRGEWLSSTKELFINCVIKILIEFEKEEERKKA